MEIPETTSTAGTPVCAKCQRRLAVSSFDKCMYCGHPIAATMPVCENCKRLLVERYFDKCMYCGHAIPENERLSTAERESIRLKREQLAEAQRNAHALYMASQKDGRRKRKGGTNSGLVDLSDPDWGYSSSTDGDGHGDGDGGGD